MSSDHLSPTTSNVWGQQDSNERMLVSSITFLKESICQIANIVAFRAARCQGPTEKQAKRRPADFFKGDNPADGDDTTGCTPARCLTEPGRFQAREPAQGPEARVCSQTEGQSASRLAELLRGSSESILSGRPVSPPFSPLRPCARGACASSSTSGRRGRVLPRQQTLGRVSIPHLENTMAWTRRVPAAACI